MYTDLVEKCEECVSRAASWRCNDCRQIYCSRCLLGLHSIGGPFAKHIADPLPYYSPEMHRRFEEDDMQFRMKAKMDVIKHKMAKSAEQRYRAYIVQIQAWWRMLLHGRKGASLIRQKRRHIRHMYRARKKEDRMIRSTLGYKVSNFWGLAPPLSTDTAEEAALRELPWVLRHRAKEYIWKNKDDWGFYRTSRTEPRKGQPKLGFDVGEHEELVEQAKLVMTRFSTT